MSSSNLMRSHWLWPSLAVLIVSWCAQPAFAGEKEKLAGSISAIDANVLSAEERKSAANRLGEELRERVRAANQRSSHAWKDLAGPRSDAELKRWRGGVVRALKASLGAAPSSGEPLKSHVAKTISGEGYAIDNVAFTSGRRMWITANLYRPEPAPKSMPGLLIVHSHHTPKTHGELQDMGMTWARLGCLVLVMDQLGHGERRQHAFHSERDYPRVFRPSRQDYWFRYDNAIALHLVGESLIGWMAGDLMRGVDFLLARPGIDPNRIGLFGSVAGGGDPCAVAGAIDERISVVGPFNFGGPQPETRYPLPDDAESTFNYMGGGSWESTRNLYRSADSRHGTFLPWEIVGSVAPRRLLYGHEFSWDRPRDPVWKRLETIYAVYGAPENLAYAHGTGEIRVDSPEASHCTHIGRIHRVGVHAALDKWFGLANGAEQEYSKRIGSEELMVLSPELKAELRPSTLSARLGSLADERLAIARGKLVQTPAAKRAAQLRANLADLMGPVEPEAAASLLGEPATTNLEGYALERLSLKVESGFVLPTLLLRPLQDSTAPRPPIVVGISQSGKGAFLKERAEMIAELLAGGAAVCLPDLRGLGEVRAGDGRDRTSGATSYSSTELMLGGTHMGARLRDLRAVLAYLRSRKDLAGNSMALWGDSFAPRNSADTEFAVPHGIDGRAKQSEPLGGMLALLGAHFEPEIAAVYVSGGLTEFRGVLDSPFVYIPHDSVVPGLLTACDLPDLAAELAPRPLRLANLVDGLNRSVSLESAGKAYQLASNRYSELKHAEAFALDDASPPSAWLLAQLARGDNR